MELVKGTRLYERIIQHAKDSPINDESLPLAFKVWNPTPWVINVYLGDKIDNQPFRKDECDIKEWCRNNFGKESWPIHDRPGNWYRGGGTVMGWTWIGFKTEDMMKKFIFAWPNNIKPDGIEYDKKAIHT